MKNVLLKFDQGADVHRTEQPERGSFLKRESAYECVIRVSK